MTSTEGTSDALAIKTPDVSPEGQGAKTGINWNETGQGSGARYKQGKKGNTSKYFWTLVIAILKVTHLR